MAIGGGEVFWKMERKMKRITSLLKFMSTLETTNNFILCGYKQRAQYLYTQSKNLTKWLCLSNEIIQVLGVMSSFWQVPGTLIENYFGNIARHYKLRIWKPFSWVRTVTIPMSNVITLCAFLDCAGGKLSVDCIF